MRIVSVHLAVDPYVGAILSNVIDLRTNLAWILGFGLLWKRAQI